MAAAAAAAAAVSAVVLDEQYIYSLSDKNRKAQSIRSFITYFFPFGG